MLTQKVVRAVLNQLLKITKQRGNEWLPKIPMVSVCITKVAIEVNASQVFEQFIAVHETLITKLAQRMTSVRSVVWIAFSSV
jgi:hypothetical protein